jgi:glycosyltransferase involved in cell wall biosynthesis
MHLIDTLDAGGAETMCVQLANALPAERFAACVCATRRGGLLEDRIGDHVRLLQLARRGRFDLRAILRLAADTKRHRIRLLHAHGSSVFLAVVVRLLASGAKVIWHDHNGMRGSDRISDRAYAAASHFASGFVAANQALEEWLRRTVDVRLRPVAVIPNFPGVGRQELQGQLAGEPGFRIAFVANVRPVKDHAMMVRAMATIVEQEPRAHLLCVGQCEADGHGGAMRALVAALGLGGHVSFLGVRDDVGAILRQCDAGVLSSRSEGLPLALLEYGAAGLPVVCTRVGDCPEVVQDGVSGRLVAPGDHEAMAAAVLEHLQGEAGRRAMGLRLKEVVDRNWSEAAALRKVVEVYEAVLA